MAARAPACMCPCKWVRPHLSRSTRVDCRGRSFLPHPESIFQPVSDCIQLNCLLSLMTLPVDSPKTCRIVELPPWCASVLAQHTVLTYRERAEPWDTAEVSKRLSELAWPVCSNLGFSGVIGFCAGVALKVGLPHLPVVRPAGADLLVISGGILPSAVGIAPQIGHEAFSLRWLCICRLWARPWRS